MSLPKEFAKQPIQIGHGAEKFGCHVKGQSNPRCTMQG